MYQPPQVYHSLCRFRRVGKPGEKARRTNSSALNHVADCKSLYRLVLWRTPRAIGAADGLDMAPSFLITAAVRGMLVAGLRFLISVWEAYLDARFLTMVANRSPTKGK